MDLSVSRCPVPASLHSWGQKEQGAGSLHSWGEREQGAVRKSRERARESCTLVLGRTYT